VRIKSRKIWQTCSFERKRGGSNLWPRKAILLKEITTIKKKSLFFFFGGIGALLFEPHLQQERYLVGISLICKTSQNTGSKVYILKLTSKALL
jgi:hypothetical protein